MEWFIVVFCFFDLIYFVSIDDEKKVEDYSCYEGGKCPFFVCSKGYGDLCFRVDCLVGKFKNHFEAACRLLSSLIVI